MEDGTDLIIKALQKRAEERAFQLYTVKYQQMDKENYISFEDFYNPQQPKVESKSEEEILKDVKRILTAFKKEGDENRDF
ncbi:hypothetical protein BhaS171_00017 [Bacillus phage vB_BhaS-171]|uniref:hypothetical protein n=1 Tax=Bacillus phage vB_BhaS-171 TaxID=1775140 RepID=UPI000744BC4F|nr:hypothetical protein BH781_gp17 [Bacillus phage vB_BhaS-171]ALY08073.1 hypothetical protein BhaS171_00017 [Bacillus phage vB_BhaS-171]